MTWKCKNCGNEIEREELEEYLKNAKEAMKENLDEDVEVEIKDDIDSVILVDCPECDDEVATYEKDTSESTDSSNTTTRSKMLQAARS